MGTFRMTVEIADPLGQRFEAVEMLVDTGAMFTRAPRSLLERLGAPVESNYTAAWRDYREDHEAEAFLHDTWCNVIAELMPENAAWKWVSQADRYLETARRIRDEVLPRIAEEHQGCEKLVALAVQAAMREHFERFGEMPDGGFGLTVLQAVDQFLARSDQKEGDGGFAQRFRTGRDSPGNATLRQKRLSADSKQLVSDRPGENNRNSSTVDQARRRA